MTLLVQVLLRPWTHSRQEIPAHRRRPPGRPGTPRHVQVRPHRRYVRRR